MQLTVWKFKRVRTSVFPVVKPPFYILVCISFSSCFSCFRKENTPPRCACAFAYRFLLTFQARQDFKPISISCIVYPRCFDFTQEELLPPLDRHNNFHKILICYIRASSFDCMQVCDECCRYWMHIYSVSAAMNKKMTSWCVGYTLTQVSNILYLCIDVCEKKRKEESLMVGCRSRAKPISIQIRNYLDTKRFRSSIFFSFLTAGPQ